MTKRREATLARIHRVRTLQLNLRMGDEARAREQVASEQALSARIAGLVDAVAPVPTAPSASVSLMAAAHFRERLHQSAEIALRRIAQAEQQADAAAEQTRSAKRDQSAVEKLIERAQAAAVMREMRALEDAPANRKNRHDPC
ncbi:hypothetical protein ACLN6N_11865 [Sphingomonas carotinifaciens]|uniref:Flagellar FliJ protein n=1 Tax=Sphingomonas carotinifaciens TaxID=1166323 RepID=A0A1G7GLZ0_9SPHN|nr:hypothetical protein [Sphingomonas carotinifaciens]MBB4086585.1 MoxR-like ATPase [Sphingomonas carotinifaciens]MWC42936.1 hypothetical protein [Sphingomonas carotinifaciens]SDE89155.1 hypothetical protein SAMN05216557_101944 [Sphingomonas carotinifaciens]